MQVTVCEKYMSHTRIGALLLRYTYLYSRSPARVMELFFWPVMELLVWGYFQLYLTDQGNSLPPFFQFLIGALIFWDFLYRCQMGVSIAVLEDIWSRNFINLFVSPLTVNELLGTTFIVCIFKACVPTVVLSLLAYALYGFNVLQLGPIVFFGYTLLLMFGFALGVFTTALILRFGHAAEALAWGVPFLVQPLSAVFYPVSVLPFFLRWPSHFLPASYVFEGIRHYIQTGSYPVGAFATAFVLNLLWLALMISFFHWTFHAIRVRGLLGKVGME